MNIWFLFPLSKLETRISNFSFYSRNPRSEFHISLSTLEIRDQNLVFLFLLSKFETRISNFSFYSRNSRSEFQISLSTLEFTFFDSRQCLAAMHYFCKPSCTPLAFHSIPTRCCCTVKDPRCFCKVSSLSHLLRCHRHYHHSAIIIIIITIITSTSLLP